MNNVIVPEQYRPNMDVRTTERAIKFIKDTFEREFKKALHLERISAPLFVRPETGLNDNLSGIERPVSFDVPDASCTAEIVQSLAKWKRMALHEYDFTFGEGIYTDMNAIRRDEELDNLHSIYVDQWDWEKIVHKNERNLDTLKYTVKRIYNVIAAVELMVCSRYPEVSCILPHDIFFITAQELEDLYPGLSPKERENEITKEKKAVFIMQIGKDLKSGKPHDKRSPDYDDWELNGDIMLWFPLLDCAIEISSMGIRVDEDSLEEQLELAGYPERKALPFHQMLINGKLPYTIGGGIGQSRLCMFMLKRAHVGEVQASLWSDEMRSFCKKNNMFLL